LDWAFIKFSNAGGGDWRIYPALPVGQIFPNTSMSLPENYENTAWNKLSILI